MIPRWEYFFDEGLTPDPTGQFVKYEDHEKAMSEERGKINNLHKILGQKRKLIRKL